MEEEARPSHDITTDFKHNTSVKCTNHKALVKYAKGLMYLDNLLLFLKVQRDYIVRRTPNPTIRLLLSARKRHRYFAWTFNERNNIYSPRHLTVTDRGQSPNTTPRNMCAYTSAHTSDTSSVCIFNLFKYSYLPEDYPYFRYVIHLTMICHWTVSALIQSLW